MNPAEPSSPNPNKRRRLNFILNPTADLRRHNPPSDTRKTTRQRETDGPLEARVVPGEYYWDRAQEPNLLREVPSAPGQIGWPVDCWS